MEFLRAHVVSNVSRSLLLAGGAFALTLFGGYYWVCWLREHNFGKRVREDGPQSHFVKTGTPTMGGLMIIASVVILTMLFNLVGRFVDVATAGRADLVCDPGWLRRFPDAHAAQNRRWPAMACRCS